MADLGQLNVFNEVGIGDIGFVLLVFALAVVIVGLIGLLLFVYIQKKKLKYTIPLWKKMGNNVVRVAKFKAKDFSISMAGDKLWHIPKIKKYIPIGTIQTAPNEYTYFEREDNEWINIGMPDIDEVMKLFKVKFVNQDMRANRIATSEILEQRFKDQKSWWEKYGHLVTHVIFYMIVALMMVVIFYQWSDIVERTSGLIAQIDAIEQSKHPTSIVPALIPLILFKPKRRKKE